LDYRNSDARIDSDDDPTALFENLVTFGPVTLQFTGLICVPVYLKWVKIGIHPFIRSTGVSKRYPGIAMPMGALTAAVIVLRLVETW